MNETLRRAAVRATFGAALVLLYLGVGSWVHSMLVGGQLDAGSGWTWAVLLLWPLLLLPALAIMSAILGLFTALSALAHWIFRRRR